MFWIAFQLGSLIGFIFIGIAAFKLTPDQMNAEAGMFVPTESFTSHVCFVIDIFFSARFLPT